MLFGFTRVFAIAGSSFALLGLVILVFLFVFSGSKNTFVSLTDINPVQQTPNAANKQGAMQAESKIQLPENVKKYLSGDNEKVLNGWLKSLDKSDKEDFVSNLSSIIAEAEKNNQDIIGVINTYKEIKLEKLKKSEFEKYEKMASKGALIGSMFALVLLIGLLAIVLVMLAIERNTRNTGILANQNNPAGLIDGPSHVSFSRANIMNGEASATD
jgi:hypothetical protein